MYSYGGSAQTGRVRVARDVAGHGEQVAVAVDLVVGHADVVGRRGPRRGDVRPGPPRAARSAGAVGALSSYGWPNVTSSTGNLAGLRCLLREELGTRPSTSRSSARSSGAVAVHERRDVVLHLRVRRRSRRRRTRRSALVAGLVGPRHAGLGPVAGHGVHARAVDRAAGRGGRHAQLRAADLALGGIPDTWNRRKLCMFGAVSPAVRSLSSMRVVGVQVVLLDAGVLRAGERQRRGRLGDLDAQRVGAGQPAGVGDPARPRWPCRDAGSVSLGLALFESSNWPSPSRSHA